MTYVQRTSARKFKLLNKARPFLGQLDIELTERCNNNCMHCCINLPADDRFALEQELNTRQIEHILQEAASLGALQVRFTGGEPLLRPDFEELYLTARRLGMRVLISTNARLVSARLAGLFARIPPLIPIEITVYGMSAKSYEAVTHIDGSFGQFWQGMELLRDRNVAFVVRSAVLPPNRHELDLFESWAAKIPWMNHPPAYTMFFHKRYRKDDTKRDETIEALRLSPEESLAAKIRNPEQYRKEMMQFCWKFLGPPGDKLFCCGAGEACSVDAYGRLQPCLGLRAPELTYDLLDGSLEQALRDVFPQLCAIRAGNPLYLERCARCFLKSMCDQCPATSWNETGTLDTPVELVCACAHAEARWLGLIGPLEHAWDVRNWRSRIEEAFRVQIACDMMQIKR